MSRIVGVNMRYYPTDVHFAHGWNNARYMPTVAVLVAGEIGDYACYVGHGSEEFVAQFGDKISFAEACCHFPGGQLKKENYRD